MIHKLWLQQLNKMVKYVTSQFSAEYKYTIDDKYVAEYFAFNDLFDLLLCQNMDFWQ